MKKVSVLLLIVVLIFTSTCVSFAGNEVSYEEKVNYLKEMGVLSKVGDYLPNQNFDRIQAAAYITRVMKVTDPNWKYTDEHSFKDVPKWANEYVGTANSNGIIKGVSDNDFGNRIVSIGDYLTMMLRALGYGNNDSIQEFTWNNSISFAYDVGLINYDQRNKYKNIRLLNEFTMKDMVDITYQVVKRYNNNPYTDEYLRKLIKQNPPSNEISTFRQKDSSTKKNFNKASFTYFDIYYPNTEEGKTCLQLLTPHADKVYAMLQDLYGIQPAVDVYLVPDDQRDTLTQPTTPGVDPILKNDRMTYVVLAKDQDIDGNNLGELIRELNNVFLVNSAGLTDKNITYTEATMPWRARATMNLVGSLYSKSNYSGKIDQSSVYEIPSMRINLRNVADSGLSKNEATQMYQMYYYAKCFSIQTPESFKGCLSNIWYMKEPEIDRYLEKPVLEMDKMPYFRM